MTRKQLAEKLNDDLKSEYQAIIMYITYAAAATGPHRPMLKQFFEQEIPEELAHAQFLAEKVASLGGVPATEPKPVPAAEGPREMLANVLEAERAAISAYKQRSRDAAELGDVGLSARLETLVEDETHHFEETEKILRGWQ